MNDWDWVCRLGEKDERAGLVGGLVNRNGVFVWKGFNPERQTLAHVLAAICPTILSSSGQKAANTSAIVVIGVTAVVLNAGFRFTTVKVRDRDESTSPICVMSMARTSCFHHSSEKTERMEIRNWRSSPIFLNPPSRLTRLALAYESPADLGAK